MDVGGLFVVRVDNQIEISLLLVFASSFEEVVTLYVISLDVHLSAPCLTQVLLHDLVLSLQGGVFKVLSVLGGSDELLISAPLILAASLAELAVGVDLVSQVRSQEFLLSLLRVQVHFNLTKCFLWTKVRFIVQLLVLELCVFALLLFSDLDLDELTVRLVLILAILLL